MGEKEFEVTVKVYGHPGEWFLKVIVCQIGCYFGGKTADEAKISLQKVLDALIRQMHDLSLDIGGESPRAVWIGSDKIEYQVDLKGVVDLDTVAKVVAMAENEFRTTAKITIYQKKVGA